MARLISPRRARPSRAPAVDNGEEFQRGFGGAALAIAVAKRKLHALIVEIAFERAPFVIQRARADGAGGQAERLGGGNRARLGAKLKRRSRVKRAGRTEMYQAASEHDRACDALTTENPHLTPLSASSAGLFCTRA